MKGKKLLWTLLKRVKHDQKSKPGLEMVMITTMGFDNYDPKRWSNNGDHSIQWPRLHLPITSSKICCGPRSQEIDLPTNLVWLVSSSLVCPLALLLPAFFHGRGWTTVVVAVVAGCGLEAPRPSQPWLPSFVAQHGVGREVVEVRLWRDRVWWIMKMGLGLFNGGVEGGGENWTGAGHGIKKRLVVGKGRIFPGFVYGWGCVVGDKSVSTEIKKFDPVRLCPLLK